jgi:hypothetical protein
VSRKRRIDPRHDNQVEGKLEDHRRGGGANKGAGQGDLPAPTPREVEDHKEGHRRIGKKRADPHARRDKARIGQLHL